MKPGFKGVSSYFPVVALIPTCPDSIITNGLNKNSAPIIMITT